MIIGIAMLVTLVGTEPQSDLTVDELIAAHQATIDAIHELDFVLDSGREGSSLAETVRYSSDGMRERFRRESLQLSPDSPKRFEDNLRDGESVSRLEGVDPKAQKTITNPFESKGINASKVDLAASAPAFKSLGLVKLRFSIAPLDRHRTLAELTADSRSVHGESAVTLLRREVVEEHECFRIRLRHPGLIDPNTGSRMYENGELHVLLDPSVGYLARRTEVYRKGAVPEEDIVITTTVTEFHAFANGVYFPVELRSTAVSGGSHRRTLSEPAVFHVRNLTVNAPLPADAMDFQFPENVLVTQEEPNGQATVFLMGRNNEIAKVMKSKEEVNALMEAMHAEHVPVRESLLTRGLIASASAVLIALLIFVRRRCRRSSS